MLRLFELGFLIRAIDQMSAPLRGIDAQVDRLNESVAATRKWRDAGATMMTVGAAMTGVGLAGGATAYKLSETAENFEDHIARLGTALGNAKDKAVQLAVAEEFVKKSSIETGYSAEELTESLYQGLSGFLNMGQSMAVATEAAKLARATSGDLADTTNFLATAMLNFSDPAKTAEQNATMLADKMSALQTQFKFTNLNELTSAMSYAAPQAKALGISLDQTLGAMAAFSAAGEKGSEAGTRFVELSGQLLKAAPKLGITIFKNASGQGVDFIRTLEGIRAKFGDISADPHLAAEFQKAFGLRAGPALALLLNNLDKAKAAMTGVAHSAGAANTAEAEFEKRGTLQWAKFAQAVHVLWIDLGQKLAPAMTTLAQRLTVIVGKITAFVQAHPQAAKLAVEIVAIGSALSIVAGGMTLVTGGLLYFASFVPVAISAFGTIAAAAGALDLALLANPIGLVIAGLAALAVAGYEVYEHWGAIKPALETAWMGIKGFFNSAEAWVVRWAPTVGKVLFLAFTGPFGLIAYELYRHWTAIKEFLSKGFFTAGWALIKTLALGILHGIELEIPTALKNLGTEVMRYLPWHSPAEAGPLHYLNRVHIIGSIVETIKNSAPELTAALSGVFSGAVHAAGRLVGRSAWQVGAGVKAAWQGVKSLAGAEPAAILHGLMGVESSYGKMLTNPASSAIGPYQMTRGFRATWGVLPTEAMSAKTSTEVANKIIFGAYLPEFGGDVAKALSAWHQGPGWVHAHGVDRPYVAAVMSRMAPVARESRLPASNESRSPARSGITINVHYNPIIHGGMMTEHFDPHKHADKLVRIIEAKLARNARLQYE